MQVKKISSTVFAIIGIVALIALFVIGVQSQSKRLKLDQDLISSLHMMRFSLVASSEALSNAVLSKSDANADKFGQDALQKIEEFKNARQQVESQVQGATELKILQEIDSAFAKFEKLCDRLVHTSKQNSNRKAYALAVGPCLELAKSIDGELAQSLKTNGLEESSNSWGIEIYEARLALFRIQSTLVRHIFEATDEVMDMLELELKSELGRIDSILSSLQLTADESEVQRIAATSTKVKEFKNYISEIITLSRQNSNVYAEDVAMTARIEATLNCETKLNVLEQILQKQLDSGLPKGRGN